jgi:hypothetical protein
MPLKSIFRLFLLHAESDVLNCLFNSLAQWTLLRARMQISLSSMNASCNIHVSADFLPVYSMHHSLNVIFQSMPFLTFFLLCTLCPAVSPIFVSLFFHPYCADGVFASKEKILVFVNIFIHIIYIFFYFLTIVKETHKSSHI